MAQPYFITYTHREGDNNKRNKKKKNKERERRIPRRHQPVADADASNSFFSRLQLLFFFSRRCVHFFISFIPFLSFVRPNVGRRRNDDINKTLSDAKNIIYMTSKSQKRPENFVTSPLSPILVLKS